MDNTWEVPPLPPNIQCPNCGATTAEENEKCGNCGAFLVVRESEGA